MRRNHLYRVRLTRVTTDAQIATVKSVADTKHVEGPRKFEGGSCTYVLTLSLLTLLDLTSKCH
jgi:hypothetical protein